MDVLLAGFVAFVVAAVLLTGLAALVVALATDLAETAFALLVVFVLARLDGLVSAGLLATFFTGSLGAAAGVVGLDLVFFAVGVAFDGDFGWVLLTGILLF